MPTYSSRWNISTRDQSMSVRPVSASRNSNCDAPVAARIRALPRAAIARLMASAAWPAAAVPRSCLLSKTEKGMDIAVGGFQRIGARLSSARRFWDELRDGLCVPPRIGLEFPLQPVRGRPPPGAPCFLVRSIDGWIGRMHGDYGHPDRCVVVRHRARPGSAGAL